MMKIPRVGWFECGAGCAPAAFRSHCIIVAMLAVFVLAANFAHAAKPNFIIIFTDDQGYGDLGCFGSTTIRTPNVDRLAQEGRKFTSFMVASPVCTFNYRAQEI